MTLVEKLFVTFACAGFAVFLALIFDTQKEPTALPSIELDLGRITDLTTNGFTLRTSFKPCEARVTNGQWTIHFKR